jgi:ABC-type antimicrobial peptide transport system permease subunit
VRGWRPQASRVGVAGAFSLARLMAGLLYGTSTADPLTYAALALLLASVAVTSCLLPARRAVRVDPVIALRAE